MTCKTICKSPVTLLCIKIGAKEFISSVSVPNVTADKGQFSLVYKGTEEEKLYFTSFRQQAHTISAGMYAYVYKIMF